MTAQLPLFAIGDRVDPWTVRTSGRARRLSVRVYPGGRVEIVVPPGASPNIVQRFIGEHRQWIDDRVRDFAEHVHVETVLPQTLELQAIGQRYAIDYRDSEARPRLVGLDSRTIRIIGSRQDPRAVAQCLRRWLLEIAVFELDTQLRTIAEQFGFHFIRTQIRRQRTRWGSCSAHGTISLNVSLLFLEPELVRYLMIHELCHTKQMNHSPRFWALVESCEPDYLRLDRALTRSWRQVPWWMFG